ncbi:MAG TPA: DinB family protein [Acidimicrobiales bacterium]|nr:DinB family protein [Acidimicrobiales bacterium]
MAVPPGDARADPPPKTLDDFRRERGEGWQWARAQSEQCPQCGQNAAALDRALLGPALLRSADEWRSFLVAADDAYLRRVPAPGVFSPIQYGSHVRDIQHVYGDRILLMLEEDNPVFPQFNPDEASWNAFNEIEAEILAAQIRDEAQRLADILDGLEPDDWSRTMIRDGGSDGVYSFTVAGLASYAVHESHHHLLDANGTLDDARGATEGSR